MYMRQLAAKAANCAYTRPLCAIKKIKMTIEEFIERLSELEPAFKSSNKNLEEYWRSMYPLVIQKKHKKPTLELFFELIKDSIENPPIKLNADWLKSINPPESNLFEEEVKNGEKELKSDNDEFEFFLKVLEFQIAELHKMKDKELKNEHRYFGINSETGNRWFNFDPMGILDCGLSGMESNGFNKDLENWIFLGEIIEMGRIYE